MNEESSENEPVDDVINSRQIRYLAIGGLNTVVGYCLGVGLYYLLSSKVHILAIGAIANVLAISASFATYKLFVFQTPGRWINGYLRSYVVYGGMAIVSIVLLWVLVDGLRLPIWLAQGISILVAAVISYLGHSRYTFRVGRDIEVRQSK